MYKYMEKSFYFRVKQIERFFCFGEGNNDLYDISESQNHVSETI